MITSPPAHQDDHTHPHPRVTTLSPEERLRLVGDLARTLSTILEPSVLIQCITELITHRFDFFYTTVMLREGEDLVVHSGHGRDHGYDERVLGMRCRIGEQGVSGWAALEGRTIVVPDVSKEPRFCWAWSDHGIKSAILIPLQGRERLIGMLEADSDRLNDFPPEDQVLLEALAMQLAIVIENAELLQAERRRSQRLATITEIARKVTSILDLQELLDQTTELIAERFGYHSVGIMLRDREDDQWLVMAAGNRGAMHAVAGYRQHITDGMCGRAALTGLTQLSNDTRTNPHFLECTGHVTRAELDVPIKVAGRVLGVLGIESDVPNVFQEDAVPFIETLADQIAVAIENAWLMERARELAASDERNRLAREIHDTLAQSLIAVSMELDAIDRRLRDDPAHVAGLVNHARGLAHRAVEEARHAIWRLRPASLERQSLAEALAAEVTSLEQGGAVVEGVCTIQGECRPVAAEVEAAVFRITQEALSNVRKHARARRVRVVLAYGDRSLRLLIEDDGRGFDPNAPVRPGDGGFGIEGMRQRAALVGGDIELDSSPGWGTRIRVFVPEAPTCDTDEAPTTIRVLLADDHTLVREGIRRMIDGIGNLALVGEAENGKEAVERALELAPDVVLMDVQMPELDGLAATRRIRAQAPSTGVIILSTNAPDDVVLEAVRAGARGYLLKDVSLDELQEAVHTVAAGGSYFTPTAAAKLAGGVRRGGTAAERLTPRELAVLRRLATGAPNKEIAAALSISENTVESHLRSIYGKLEVRSRTEALRRATEWGILAV
jgi:DNA-binding NarL/FixJ family response regulator/signal transduction histidine kinase